jgi:hypothetical protein
VRRVGPSSSAETWSCAADQKVITAPANLLGWGRHSSAKGGFSCGQPVQNLCLPWAQYIGVAVIETQAAFLAKNMTKAAANIVITS